jgi:enamine deaminase RidA (YjgF/YER057c/UK114 family)
MTVERMNPDSMHRPTGYTHVVRARGGTTIYIAGQVALDAGGVVVAPGDLGGQTRQVFLNLQTALAAADAGFQDIVKLNTYIVDYRPELRDVYRAVRNEFLPADPPASTLVGVQALAQPEFLIEVEAIAVIEE